MQREGTWADVHDMHCKSGPTEHLCALILLPLTYFAWTVATVASLIRHLSIIYLNIAIPDNTRGLLLIYARLKKAGPLSVLHVAHLQHRGDSLGGMLQNSWTGVEKTQNRGEERSAAAVTLQPCAHTLARALSVAALSFLSPGTPAW